MYNQCCYNEQHDVHSWCGSGGVLLGIKDIATTFLFPQRLVKYIADEFYLFDFNINTKHVFYIPFKWSNII